MRNLIFWARNIGIALSRGDERCWLLVFFLPYCAKLLENLSYSLSLARRPLDFAESYAATEWLINYSSGFVRRGLEGEALHALWRYWSIQPFLGLVFSSVFVYFVYAAWAWHSSKGLIPRWTLLTTPLIGYPVYVGKIFLRKDVLVLLLIVVAMTLVVRYHSIFSDGLACFVLSILVITHEVGAFLAIVPVSIMMLLREGSASLVGGSNVIFNNDFQSNLENLGRIFRRALPSLMWLMLPLASFASVIIHSGSESAAVIVASSWKGAYDPTKEFPGPSGAIAWLGKTLEKDGIPQTNAILNQQYSGIPYWLILLIAIVTGIVFIYLSFYSRSAEVAWFFACSSVVQFVCMAPLFFIALDHVRWIVLSLNSAFIFTVMTPFAWRDMLYKIFPPPLWLIRIAIPAFVAPIGLAFWGLQLGPWNAYTWLMSTPAGFILQIYFYLRVIGIIPDLGK